MLVKITEWVILEIQFRVLSKFQNNLNWPIQRDLWVEACKLDLSTIKSFHNIVEVSTQKGYKNAIVGMLINLKE